MSQFPPPPASANPAVFDPMGAPAEVKGWPKTIGIISVVIGSLGLLCNGCGAVMNGVNAMGGQAMQVPGPDGKPIDMPDIMKPGMIDVAGGVVGFLLSILLVVAGTMLIARRPAARALHLGYAGFTTVVSIVLTATAAMRILGVKDWAAKNPDHPAAKMADMIVSFGLLGIVLGLALGLAYPVFLLIWFGMVKRDTREITAGVEEPVA